MSGAAERLEPTMFPLAYALRRTTVQCTTIEANERKAGVTMEKTAQTTIRMTDAEREAWEKAARLDGRTLSAWIVRRCNGEPTIAPVLSAPARVAKPRRKRKVQ